MADRTLSVKLLADIQGYVQGMDKVAAKTRETTATVEQKLAEQKRAYEQVGAAAMTIGALAAAGVTAAVVAFANFDQAMSNVQAATHESAENMGLLRDAALEAGARTVFSATEAAGAIEELAKAGISTADILSGGLDGALDLAAAGGLAVADAAEIAASAMTQFGLKGSEVTHIADLLAAGAGKAQGGVSELGDALNQSGLVASQMGLSIDETVGSLAAFASAGLIGSDAGTSFRAMLLRLANPTKESSQLMDDLGLSFYDAQGAFIGVEGMAGQLQDRLADLTQEQRNQALAQIFGQDAIRTSAILYEQGAEGVREWTAAVDDSGYAAETAATRLDNLKGDFEQLTGALETALIGIGESGDGPLRTVVTGLADLVTGFTELPGPVQQSVGVLGGVVAVVGLVGGGAMVAIPQVVAFRTSLATLGVTAASTRAALASTATFLTNPYVIALAAAVAATMALQAVQDASRATAEEYEQQIRNAAGAAALFESAQTDFRLSGFEFDVENVEKYGDMVGRLGDFFVSFEDAQFAAAIGDVNAALGELSAEDAVDGFRQLADEMELSRDEAAELLDQMPAVRSALLEQANALDADVLAADGSIDSHKLLRVAYEETGDAAGGAESGIAGVGDAAEDAADATANLYDQTKALNDLWFESQDAMRNYEQGVDDITAALTGDDALVPALTESRDAFNLDEEAGREASAMLDDLVIAAQGASEAMSANGDAAEDVATYQDRARQQIYNAAIQMGLSEDAARRYADRLVAIPDDVSTEVSVETAAAEAAIARLTRTRNILITTSIASDGQRSGLGGSAPVVDLARASGGIIPGPPSSTDNIIAALATGEYVVNAAMTSRYRHVLDAINSGRFPAYATGGYVGGYAAPSPVVNVAAPSVAFPSQMQMQVNIGGQFFDAVAQVIDTVDSRSALAVRQGDWR